MRARVALIAVVAAATAASGCFYGEAIDERPSAAIGNQPGSAVYRGDMVTLMAETSSPTGNPVYVQWLVYACTDASDAGTDCDAMPIDSDTAEATMFTVPPMRADKPVPTLAMRVLLNAEDDLGAMAVPQQELIIPVGDHPPVLKLSDFPAHGFVETSHVTLDITITDPDDDPTTELQPLMALLPSPGAGYSLSTPVLLSNAASTATFQSELVADVPGTWTIAVTATDPEGLSTSASYVFAVGSDLPPCIGVTSPIADPANTYPLLQPTLFEVPLVTDDLDPYPPTGGSDPDPGEATFHWSIMPPGGSAYTPLGVTGNAVPLDPATYSSGDTIALRVEIHDRVARDFSGCGSANTCALDPEAATCLQRTTWIVTVP